MKEDGAGRAELEQLAKMKEINGALCQRLAYFQKQNRENLVSAERQLGEMRRRMSEAVKEAFEVRIAKNAVELQLQALQQKFDATKQEQKDREKEREREREREIQKQGERER